MKGKRKMYGIMRIEKRKEKDTYGIEKENNRSADEKKEFVASDIDYTRTEQNFYFMKAINFKKTIAETLKENGIEKYRKDAVFFLDGLYTASPTFFQNKSREEIIEYFSNCLKFHEKYYGKTFNAVIHFDENTPHMHVQSIPIIKADGKIKLSAKEIMGNQKKYHEMQDKYFTEVSSKYGLERGEVKDTEHQREHLTSLQYKVKMQEEELEKKERKIREQAKNIRTLESYTLELKSKIQYIQEWLKAEKQIDADLEIEYKRRKEREIGR